MTLSEQAAVVLKAIDLELVQSEDVVRWADRLIDSMEHPPHWLIDVSTLPSLQLRDVYPILRERASSLSARQQIQVIALTHENGLLSLRAALPHLFQVAILERGAHPLDSLEHRLKDALIQWDCQDDLDVIESHLLATLESTLRQYLQDAGALAAVVPWRSKTNADCM